MRVTSLFLTFVGLALFGISSIAAESFERVIEEIVVTAQKREQNLLDVSISVQAFLGEDLERAGVGNVIDVISMIPGASVPAVISPGTQTWQIRGITPGQAIGEATVGAYLDEFAFNIPQQPFAPPANIFDVERVEVLRGPHGTLYGQGSMGGVVKIVTRDPVFNEFQLRGQASYSDMDEGGDSASVDIAINIPIVDDKFAIRVTLSGSKSGGYADAILLGQEDINDNDTLTGRIKAKWKPNEKLTVTASAWRFDSEQGYTNRIDNVDPPETNDTGPGETPADWTLYSLLIEYDLGFATLLSQTGTMEQSRELLAIGSQPAFGNFDILTTSDLDSFAQEIRLTSNGDSKVNWLLGYFYQDSDVDSSSDFAITLPILRSVNQSTNSSESSAFFGEVSVDLMDGKLVPLLGVRYFDQDQDLEQDNELFLDGVLAVASTQGRDANEDDTSFRFNLAYYPTDHSMFFLNSAEGFRSGGIQTDSNVGALRAIGVPAEAALEPDTLISHELGAKWSGLLNGTLSLEGVFYYTDWKDAQLQFSPAGISGILNVGDVEAKGFDLVASYFPPIEGLSIRLSANWNETEFKSVDPNIEAVLPFLSNGEQIPGVPEKNFNLTVSYQRSVGRYNMFFDARYNYRGDQRDIVTGEFSDTIKIFDAQVGIELENVNVRLFVDNINNERGPLQVASGRFVIPNPRQIGVRVGFHL